MIVDPSTYLTDAMHRADWTVTDLWLGSFELGGNLSHGDIERIIAGLRGITDADYDVLAAALNDHFASHGFDHPVPYRTDLPDRRG